MATDRFEPAMYSLEVNQFLIEHAGEPPEIAFNKGMPGPPMRNEPQYNGDGKLIAMREVGGVSRADAWPLIDKLYRLCQQQQHQGLEWVGVDAIKESCRNYLEQKRKWENARLRGGPAEPSRFAWDGYGRGHLQGVGSDSGFVKTYFDEGGNRHDLGVDFFPGGVSEYVPEWIKGDPLKAAPVKPKYSDFLSDDENGVMKCPVCEFSQTYTTGSQNSKNLTRARMGRHLMTAKQKVEAHRELHTFLFKGADAVVRS